MTKPKLKIAIATAGRFHVLYLARELAKLGHEVRFYSYVPRKRAVEFGLPAACHVDLFPALFPFAIWQTRFGQIAPQLCERLTWWALNKAVKATLKECDVFIFMSGIYLEAAQFASETYGATLILERGSQHVLAQDEILALNPDSERPTVLSIQRELAGYEMADRISIPSVTVESSFKRDPKAHAKLVKNPYGVDLEQFPLQPRTTPNKSVTFIYAGLWCARKGCDLLVQAVRANPKVRLIHVGTLGDVPFPTGDPQFTHHDKVDQQALAGLYAKADAFVLASREDGFGMVLSQALATGLPILCTKNTGGADLQLTPALTDRIIIVDANDAEALRVGLSSLSQRLLDGPALAPLSQEDLDALGWAAYGRRYSQNLARLIE
ncbi:MAG: glycosyltransferase family 4 protein [Hyphomonadaceae bacterium]